MTRHSMHVALASTAALVAVGLLVGWVIPVGDAHWTGALATFGAISAGLVTLGRH